MSEIKIQYIESNEEGGCCYITVVPVRSGGKTPWPRAVADALEEARVSMLCNMARDLNSFAAGLDR